MQIEAIVTSTREAFSQRLTQIGRTNALITASTLSGLYILYKTWKGISIRRKLPRFPGDYHFYFGNYKYAIRGTDGVELKLLKEQRENNSDAFTISDPDANTYIVVLTDINLVKECFIENSAHTSARMLFLLQSYKLFSETYWTPQYGIVGSSGQVWHDNRRRTLGALRELGVGRNRLEELINIEADHLIQALSAQERTTKYVLSNIFATATMNVICQLCFAMRFSYESLQFKTLYKSIRAIFGRKVFMNYRELFPAWLRRFPGIRDEKLEEFIDGVKTIREFTKTQLKKHQELYKESPTDYELNQEECMIKTFVKHFANEPSPISEDIILSVVLDMFAAGTDTTSTTLDWAVYYLRNHPEIQNLVKQEISENISSDQIVYSDLEKLPLCHAFLLETWRFGAIGPNSLPHVVTKEFTAGKYTFPKGIILLSSIFCVHRDRKVFKNPDNFDINNFRVDGKTVASENFLAFSNGPRVCIGEKIARIEAFVFTANLIKNFTFRPFENEYGANDDNAIVGLVRSPKNFNVIIAQE